MTADSSMPLGSGTPRLITLTLGAAVYTTDDDKLGTVKEVSADTFKVDVSMQPDYWLPLAAVATAGADRVLLTFPKDRLDEMKVKHESNR